MQPALRADGSKAGSIDYFELFEPSAPWSVAASHVSVFKLYLDVLRGATDDQLRKLIGDLRRRHIALALEAPVLVEPGHCVTASEPESWIVQWVARLKRLGGDLKLLAMVGPLIDGHASPQPNACRRSIVEVAAEAARVVTSIRKIYPDVEVGEIEPIGRGPGYANWQDLDEWFDAWRNASGGPLAFLHFDTIWGAPWHDDMRTVAQRTRAAGVRFGVIYKGEPSDLSDAAFTSDALERGDQVESLLSGAPDDVILQSWEDYPRLALPDTDSSTMTGLVRAYVRSTTRLVRTAPGHVALLRDDQTAIAEAPLLLELHDPRPGQTLQSQSLVGMTPHTAHSALVGLRLHTECDCSHQPSDVLIAGYDFKTSNAQDEYRGHLGAWYAPPTAILTALKPYYAPVLKVHAAANQPVILNGPTFQVLPDQPFTLNVSSQVEPEGDGTGFVVMVFKTAGDAEVQRAFLWLRTSWRQVSALRTGKDGGTALPQLRGAAGGILRVRFAGDLANRPSVLVIR